MKQIQFRSDFDVDLVQFAGSDEFICRAARVSTLGAASLATEESKGLIGYLMRNRHGSPFEHGLLSMRITCPIAVWREFMRHRIGFSYNEQSGRYMELEGVFYIPPRERPLVQIGKAGAYSFVQGTDEQYFGTKYDLEDAYLAGYVAYQRQLDRGIAKEVARFPMGVGLYSTAYVTMNPRSLMSFLSLRTKDEDSKFPSFPQWEIEQVAFGMEAHFAELFPLTHAAFCENGRVAP